MKTIEAILGNSKQMFWLNGKHLIRQTLFVVTFSRPFLCRCWYFATFQCLTLFCTLKSCFLAAVNRQIIRYLVLPTILLCKLEASKRVAFQLLSSICTPFALKSFLHWIQRTKWIVNKFVFDIQKSVSLECSSSAKISWGDLCWRLNRG